MLWFLKDKKKKRRRRRSTDSGRSSETKRPDTRDARRSSRRSRRSSAEDRRETKREDTRDRDERRKEQSRDRTVAREREEILAAINFDDEPVELDEVDRSLAKALTIGFYSLLGVLVLGILVYAFGRGVSSWNAARVAPVLRAAESGNLERLRDLVEAGAPVNGVGPEGGTPMASAIRAGQPGAAEVLLQGGATPTDSIMRMAMRHEQWQILSMMIEAGGNPNVRGTWNGRSPLELAVERRDMDMIRLLLERGADPSDTTHEGPRAQPALHYAAEHGMREVVEVLLEYGSDPGRRWMGYLPEDLAADGGHEQIVEMLIEFDSEQ